MAGERSRRMGWSARGRWMTRGAVFMVAGAVVTLAVAWVAAVLDVVDGSGRDIEARLAGPAPDGGSPIWWNVVVNETAVSTWVFSYCDFGATPSTPVGDPRGLLPWWAADAGPGHAVIDAAVEKRELAVLWRQAQGWPLRCMVAHGEATPSGQRDRYALRFRANATSRFPFLPLRPIAAGFAANTLLYAAGLWMIATACRAARRRQRRRRGLCEACAYPVGASAVCTECGVSHNLSRRPSGAAIASSME